MDIAGDVTLLDLYPDMPNPFPDEYTKQEIEWYKAPEDFDVKEGSSRVTLRTVPLLFRVDDYLNVNWRADDTLRVPIFYIDGHVWMSLTPMEIQSAALAIYLSVGEVATSGLGMGYYALRAAAKDDVEYVDVYERDANVIDVFTKAHSHRPEFEKIILHHGDVREMLKGRDYDFVFMDTYQTMLDDDVLSDIPLFCGNNNIGQYWFWGIEKLILSAFEYGMVVPDQMLYPVRAFLHKWSESEGGQMRTNGCPDEDYLERGVSLLEKHELLA